MRAGGGVSGSEWTLSLSRDRARRGSRLAVSLFAPGIAQARDIAIGGAGVDVDVDVDAPAGPDERRLTLAVAADAPPGWRDIELSLGGERRRIASAIQILEVAASGGRGAWPGIGSHLI